MTGLPRQEGLPGSYRLRLAAADRIEWAAGEGDAARVHDVDPATLGRSLGLRLAARPVSEDLL